MKFAELNHHYTFLILYQLVIIIRKTKREIQETFPLSLLTLS